MSKAVLISIKPEWCRLIAAGAKTVEVRKSRPRLEAPFKCYIYCTKTKEGTLTYLARKKYGRRLYWEYKETKTGHVIGEFMCDKVWDLAPICHAPDNVEKMACLSRDAIVRYLNKHIGFGWHITEPKIYYKPLPVGAFFNECIKQDCENCGQLQYDAPRNAWWCDDKKRLNRPPQSWCYVEG